ncbi:chemotaxis protein CheW [Saccharospirillum mangrovi]|uniref:chemotaxis protein CheW n=1 Tax=Saccharospirillum mangrovi TaxID=2161747 RepID=UPI000D3A8420|nr:chemotaxis protein CheW [Saccharospirillum mangrovi]
MAVLTPLALLRDLAQRYRVQATDLPDAPDLDAAWSGIGFRLGPHALVVAMSEVSEILQAPKVTRLPNVQAWVLGVANVRGRLLPLLDLPRFFDLGDSSGRPHRGRPVLVVEQGEQSDGLVVDALEGMQHFADEDFSTEMPDIAASLQPFIRGQYRRDQRQWALISLTALVAHPQFQQVALS